MLSAGEYQHLVELAEVDLPPGWEPNDKAHSASARSELAKRGVLERNGDRFMVHPSVLMNLRILAAPMVMVDTTVSIGRLGSRSLHTVAEQLGASLSALDDGAVLVGHSQGGIVVARAANDFVTSGEYNVTHVVTAGSPIGRVPVPDNVQVLSLENRNDIVPHLDASDNPDTASRTTVTFDRQTGTVRGNHQIASNYADVAQQLDGSSDPSVEAFKKSMGNFVGGSQVETYRYKVERH
ncbi:MAG: hypothetical protein ACRDQ4_07910 [Pseudonocardiaceae bacterium]